MMDYVLVKRTTLVTVVTIAKLDHLVIPIAQVWNYAMLKCFEEFTLIFFYIFSIEPVAMFFEDANDVYDDSHKNNSINHLFHHPGDNIRIICTISPDLSESDTITLRHNGEV